MSLTDLMPSTKDTLIDALKAELIKTNALLARGVSERDGDEAPPGSALWDSRVHLGLDGETGARQIRAGLPLHRSGYQCSLGGADCPGHPSKWLMCDPPVDAVGLSPVPVVLAVDPGVQIEQEARRG